MQYVALLRGINVGGKGIVKMDALRSMLTGAGFGDVKTYIQSGNVVFDTKGTQEAVARRLEETLSASLGYEVRAVVLTQKQLERVLRGAPADWSRRTGLRRYLAFVRPPVSAADILREVKPKEGIDFVTVGQGVVYMATVLSGLTKSGLTKLVASKAYKDVTIRSHGTVEKLLELMG